MPHRTQPAPRTRPAPAAPPSGCLPRRSSRPARRPLPRARLTGLGCGVLACAVMVTAGLAGRWADTGPVLAGALFLLAAVAAAVWVRPADLLCAPVAAPLAFALGLAVETGPSRFPAELALRAPWLYAGTLAAAAAVLVRAALRARRRQRAGSPVR
ncbi:hypothetical protein GCM10009716_13640 [Streptomyces sodiiphilus]|uniref:DUF6542 domain-containing protein n=1 Tax=Streptomyces sodiiphilus TaxID=226217 RepID=A0ABP5A691_9ACTN